MDTYFDSHILDLQKSVDHSLTLVHVHLGYQKSKSILCAYKKTSLIRDSKDILWI